jgi:multisubunit Na+/H+ antiporter MnhC subunit
LALSKGKFSENLSPHLPVKILSLNPHLTDAKKLALTLWSIVISISLITWNQDIQAKERTNKLTKHRVRKIAGISLIATGIGLIIALPFYQNKNKPG